MEALPVVYDISSDEESGPDKIGGIENFGWSEPKESDDWLLKLLETADEQADDSDEVILVAEFNPTSKISKSKSAKSTVKDVDDDCVILDCDPNNPVATVNDSDDGSDELLIVGEKGQVACRDYPHPRHLCAKFPFLSTPHEKHCGLCHCYVCDTVAPCPHWGVGILDIDHCHATDKVETWKMQRRSFRKVIHHSITVAPNQVKQTLQHDAIRLPSCSVERSCLSSLNTTATSLPKYQISQSSTLRPYSNHSIIASPIRTNGVDQQFSSLESRFQSQPVSHHQLGVRNSPVSRVIRKPIRRDKGNNSISSLASRFITSDVMLKRTAALGGATQARQFPSYWNNGIDSSQYILNPPLVAPRQPAVLNVGDSNRWQNLIPNVAAGSYSESVTGTGMVCPSQVEINSHSIPQINCSQFVEQHQNQRESSNQSIVQPENPIQSAHQNIYQQGNPILSTNQIQPETFCQSAHQSSFQVGFQVQDDADAGTAPNSNFDWLSGYSLNNQPCLADNSQVLVSESMNGHLDDCIQSVPAEPTWLYNLNILSPPPPPPPTTSVDDESLVFDFETCWNGLTEV